jgi:ketosteroid isomerase-like protein
MSAGSEAEIRRLLDDLTRAVRDRDVERSLAGYAPDVLAFDLVEPLQHEGSDSLRSRLADWFSSFDGPIGYELRDLDVVAGDDIGYAHSLNHVRGTTGGDQLDMWWRTTLGLRKRDGEWQVTHSHTSVPFDMETSKASLDLEP